MKAIFGTFTGRAAAALLLTAAAAAAPARAGLIVLGPGEVDIDIEFEDGAFGVKLVDEENDVEYSPGEVLLFVGPAARTTQPAGAPFNFIGAGAGNPVWVIPQILNPAVLYLGIEAAEIDPGTFATYFETDPRVSATGEWIKVTFAAVRGPGQFSVWETDAFGGLTVWASSFLGGLTAEDAYFTFSGAPDQHLNYGFTAPGLYEVDIIVSAFEGGELSPITSGVVTLQFGVETTGPGPDPAAVPEPASCGLLALGGALAVWRGRRALRAAAPTPAA